MKLKDTLIDYLVITLAITFVAFSVYFFMLPSNASIASMSGLANIISNFIPFPVSVITLVINVFLLIFGFITIGKDFGMKTIYTTIMLPTILGIFEFTFPDFVSFTNDQLLDALCYCILVSIGCSILFNHNASSGGLDIIAKFMNKYFRMDLGKALGISGMIAATASILVFDTKTLVLSILGTYFQGIVLDYFIFGATHKKRICIISKKQDEILDFILHEMHCGATKYHAYGTYSNTQYDELNVIVDKNEYLKLIQYISNVDPAAFVTVYTVNETMYQPKIYSVKNK